MPSKLEALAILFVLLPGFMCAYVTQQLAVRRPQSETDKVVEALILSFVLYFGTLPFFHYTLPLSWEALPNGSYRIAAHFSQLACLLVSSVALGLFYSASMIG